MLDDVVEEIERPGNAALEEVVMAIRTRGDYFKVRTNIDSTKIYTASRMVSTLTGLTVQRNKAIVAIARELCGFIWELLRTQPCYQAPSPLV